MTRFVARVRALLTRTAKPGQHRWLSVRVPCYVETHDALGIHPGSMVDAGVDMVNLSPFYFSQQTHDLEAVRATVPDAAVYLEMTHATAKLSHTDEKGFDPFVFTRNNEHQLYTSAHMAYEQGADGVSLFNFVYYREHGRLERGPFDEPPFHVLPRLKDAEWLAQQPQWYHLGHDWNNPRRKRVPLERKLSKGKTETFEMACAPSAEGNGRTIRWGTTLWATHLASMACGEQSSLGKSCSVATALQKDAPSRCAADTPMHPANAQDDVRFYSASEAVFASGGWCHKERQYALSVS